MTTSNGSKRSRGADRARVHYLSTIDMETRRDLLGRAGMVTL